MMINESCKYSQSNEKKNTAVCLEAHFSTRVQESGPFAGITSVESDVNQSADTKAFEHLWKQPESLLRSGWGNAKKKKKKERIEKKRKDINNTRGIQRLILFSADTSALINSRISQVVDIYRRQSPGANIVLKWSKVLDPALGSESNCVRGILPSRGVRKGKQGAQHKHIFLAFFDSSQ